MPATAPLLRVKSPSDVGFDDGVLGISENVVTIGTVEALVVAAATEDAVTVPLPVSLEVIVAL
jgi:hypothetical protein